MASSAGTLTIDLTNSATFQPLWGVNGGPLYDPGPYTLLRPHPTNNPPVTTGYQQIGVKLIRTHDFSGPFDMKEMYPNQGADPDLTSSFNFTNSDIQFRAIVTNGFEPYLRIGNSAGSPSPTAPTNQTNWVRAASVVVRHFTDTNLWGTNFIRYVEIGNEPDSTNFWDATPQPLTRFASLFSDTAKRLKADFPSLKIGGPGVTPSAVKGVGTNYLVGFLQQIAASNAPLDFLSWHNYTLDPRDYTNAANFVRSQLALHGYTNATQHVTEWNTPTPSISEPSTRCAEPGASIVAASWMAQQLSGVEVSLLYRGNDLFLDEPWNCGIFYSDAQPKANAVAAGLWNTLLAYSNRLATTSTDTNLWALAGLRSNEVAVLISNPTGNTGTWNLVLADGRVPQSLSLQHIVQTSSNATFTNVIYWTNATIALTNGTITIEPWGVHLVTLSTFVNTGLWGTATDLGGGWKSLAWFGSFQDAGSGWIWHTEHGWLYCVGTSPSSIWFWSSRLGWLWSSSSVYPFLWYNTRGAWLYYYRGTGNGSGGWFYNYGTGRNEWR